jgi:hypothetical protein
LNVEILCKFRMLNLECEINLNRSKKKKETLLRGQHEMLSKIQMQTKKKYSFFIHLNSLDILIFPISTLEAIDKSRIYVVRKIKICEQFLVKM